MNKRIWLVIASAVIVMLTGCQTANRYYLGAQVESSKMEKIPATNLQQQRWQDTYLTIDYSLDKRQGTLDLSGAFSYSLHSKMVYRRVYDMKVTFFLLDAENRVLSYREIGRALSRDLEEETKFNETFTIPEGAVAFAFGYDGTFVDEDHQVRRVWELPDMN